MVPMIVPNGMDFSNGERDGSRGKMLYNSRPSRHKSQKGAAGSKVSIVGDSWAWPVRDMLGTSSADIVLCLLS